MNYLNTTQRVRNLDIFKCIATSNKH